jgi:hypothetical protein
LAKNRTLRSNFCRNGISDYSAAYHTKRFTSQGWLYISENYIAFYSFLLGIETKLLLELKDIQDIKKEKSKRGVFSDAIKLITKDKQEVLVDSIFNPVDTIF